MPDLNPTVAVVIPCHNEEVAIGRTIDAFRAALPAATVFVYDNCSTDGTSRVAREHGAVVRYEPQKGKGNVVRRMFADVEADVYIMVDGDDTYDASAAPALIEVLLSESVDMVSAIRDETGEAAYRRGHRFGNWMLTSLVSYIFGNRSQDMLSGYRVMSRRFVKSFPALSAGFEIETELTVHALQLRCPIAERRTPYNERPPGSVSKLSTYRDGFRILRTIGLLVKDELPMQFFGIVAGVLVALSLVLATPIVLTYLDTHTVPRLPTAVLVVGLTVVAALSLVCGLVLSTVTRARNEMKRLHYLAQSIRITGR
ncbi:MAG: glycosyltransferase [Gemmatimonadaceae bacterium]|nr:glycosyltransferase [Gemmatimonadaceae bacterium]